MPKKYTWKRYWCPPDKQLTLTREGYLWKTEISFVSDQDHIQTLSDLRKEKSLILLGEPGSGKTTEIKNEVARLKEAGFFVENVDLRSIQDINELKSRPFFKKWIEGKEGLILFLDSFDESAIPPTVLSEKIGTFLEEVPKDRLSLRIACRTADQPVGGILQEAITAHFYPTATYEIAPLERSAVQNAIETSGLDIDKTLQSFDEAGLGSLAAKPLTLCMILGLLEKGTALPKKRSELFEKAFLALCEEQNLYRLSDHTVGTLDGNERIAIASRIAIYNLLKRTDAISLMPTRLDASDNDLHVAELAWDKEKVRGKEVLVTEKAIREVLGTGLFTARGGDRMGWAHQTYPDFLAALYICNRNLHPEQINSLFFNSLTNKIRPYLAECAAWLAGLDRGFLIKVAKSDPKILLRTEESSLLSKDKQELTRALLKGFEEKMILDTDDGIRSSYEKLNYTGIDADIKPFFLDKSKNLVVRRVAVEIAQACSVTSLVEDLLKITFDRTEDSILRECAARAVREIGSEEDKLKLTDLIEEDEPEEHGGELKGIALKALYPKHINLERVLSVLEKRLSSESVIHIGSIEGLVFDIEASLNSADLALVLNWTERLGDVYTMHHSNKRFLETALEKGWRNFDDPVVAKALASAIKKRMSLEGGSWSRTDAGIPESLTEDQRLGVIKFLIENQILDGNNLFSIVYGRSLISIGDVDSFLKELSLSEPSIKIVWAKLINFLVNIDDRENLEKVMRAYGDSPELQKAFQGKLGSIRLDSVEAEQAKSHLQERLRFQAMMAKKDRKKLSLAEAIRLKGVSPCNRWPMIALILNGDTGSLPEKGIETYKSWLDLDCETKEQILTIARKYLEECQMQEEAWKVTGIPVSLIFGQHALRLIYKIAHPVFQGISIDKLAHWIPAVIRGPFNPDDVDDELAHKVYDTDPIKFISVLRFYCQELNVFPRNILISWGEMIEDTFIDTLKKADLSRELYEEISNELLRQGSVKTRKLAEEVTKDASASPDLKVAMASAWFVYSPERSWPTIYALTQSNPEIGRRVFERVSQNYSGISESAVRKLHLEAQRDLYIWLRKAYPEIQPDPTTGSFYNPRDLRNSLFRSIRDSGNVASIKILEQIEHEFPEDDSVSWSKVVAMNAITDKSETPPSSEDIRTLLQSRDVRRIESGEQLVSVVMESLGRLQDILQGETPLARMLWNGDRPKDESELSDYVKVHLEKDLNGIIIAKREVEVRKIKYKTPKGEATDIQVIASPLEKGADSITLVIEAKGDWNEEVDTSMETQLRDRYLLENSYHYGIYLVGWYQANSRKAKTETTTLEATVNFFDEQAKGLTSNGILIRSKVLDIRIGAHLKSAIQPTKNKAVKKPPKKNSKLKKT